MTTPSRTTTPAAAHPGRHGSTTSALSRVGPTESKTARRWHVTQTEDGWFEWLSPAGYRYAVGPYGTLREVPALSATAA